MDYNKDISWILIAKEYLLLNQEDPTIGGFEGFSMIYWFKFLAFADIHSWISSVICANKNCCRMVHVTTIIINKRLKIIIKNKHDFYLFINHCVTRACFGAIIVLLRVRDTFGSDINLVLIFYNKCTE